MLRADTWIVETGADRVAFENLAVFVLQQLGAVAVQRAGPPTTDGGAMLEAIVDAAARRFDADQAHALVCNERMKQPDRVGAAADAGHDGVRQTAFALQNLRPR